MNQILVRIIATALTLSALYSCSEDVAMEESLNLSNGKTLERISITGKDFQVEPGTRSTVEIDHAGVHFLWSENDTIGIFPNTGFQAPFAMEEGAGMQSATFNGGGWALKASSTYAAYFPFDYDYRNMKEIPVSYEGQEQEENASTAHLGTYDFMAAGISTPAHGAVAFDMQHMGALVMLQTDMGEANTLTGVTLKSSENEFTTAGTIDLTAVNPQITATVTTNTLNIPLNNFTVTDNETITVYFMIAPTNLEDETLEITFKDELGEYINFEVVGKNFEAGKAYAYVLEHDENQGQAPTVDYGWYINSQDGVYEIGSLKEFVEFSKLTRGDSDALSAVGENRAISFLGKTIKLTSDIDLSTYCGAQLGSWLAISGFKGVFDGNDNTISGLYIYDTDETLELGLFSSIDEARVCNLTVEGEIYCLDGSKNAGGIITSASNSVIENCHTDIIIETSTESSGRCVGGICGYASATYIIACTTSVNITDYIDEWEWQNDIGGIVGYALNSTAVIACAAISGKVKETKTQSYSPVGGIVGLIPSNSRAEKIVACYSNVYIQGRMPGHILGNSQYRSYGKPSISSSYYSGSSNNNNGNKGVGTDNYGGSTYGYDYGTSRVDNVSEAIDAMNEEIDKWNTSASVNAICNYKYDINPSGDLILVKQN